MCMIFKIGFVRGLNLLNHKQRSKLIHGIETGGGGGITRVLENGNTFEKGGVNISAVHGTLENITPDSLFHILLKQVDNKTFKLDNAQFFCNWSQPRDSPQKPVCTNDSYEYSLF